MTHPLVAEEIEYAGRNFGVEGSILAERGRIRGGSMTCALVAVLYEEGRLEERMVSDLVRQAVATAQTTSGGNAS